MANRTLRPNAWLGPNVRPTRTPASARPTPTSSRPTPASARPTPTSSRPTPTSSRRRPGSPPAISRTARRCGWRTRPSRPAGQLRVDGPGAAAGRTRSGADGRGRPTDRPARSGHPRRRLRPRYCCGQRRPERHDYRRCPARPAQPRRYRHPVGQRGPLPGAPAPVEAGCRVHLERTGGRHRACPPADAGRATACGAIDHGQPPAEREHLCTRSFGEALSPLRGDRAGSNDRAADPGADSVLLPRLPGWPRPNRRRPFDRTARFREP